MTGSDQILQKKQVPNEVGLLDQLQINFYTILYHLSVISFAKSREEIIYSEVKIGVLIWQKFLSKICLFS